MMIVFAIALAAPQLSQSNTATPAAVAQVDEKKTCRSETATGSHFAKKTCHTKAEWKLVDAENAAASRATSNGGRTGMQSEPFTHQPY